ncbi:MAG: hypothetical protein V1913_18235 [Fibrobacterota bacterium]
MKMYKCEIKGMVDAGGCFNCYVEHKGDGAAVSRVLCKQTNITQAVEVEEPVEVGA